MFLVELLLHHHSGEGLLAYLHLKRSAELVERHLHKSHAHALIGGDSVITCGNLTHRFAVLQYGVAMTWDSLALKFDAHETTLHSVLLLIDESLATYELRFVELAENAQSCHHGRYVGREFVAIKRQSHLEAQCVATSQSAGLAASAGDEFVPALADVVMRTIDFKSVLTRISRAAHDNCASLVMAAAVTLEANGLDGVECEFGALQSKHLLNHLLRVGTLHRQLSVEVGAVLYVDVITLGMLSHPCPVLVDVCGIDDDEEVILAHLIHKEVIHRTTVLIAHHAIENLSRFHSPNIVGKDMVDVSLGIRTLDSYLAHVGHIEHSTGIAHSLVLVLDVGILDRHVESAERTD